MGSIQWHLMICNGLAWLISSAALIKGVKSLGKVCSVLSFILIYITNEKLHDKNEEFSLFGNNCYYQENISRAHYVYV